MIRRLAKPIFILQGALGDMRVREKNKDRSSKKTIFIFPENRFRGIRGNYEKNFSFSGNSGV